MNRVLEEARGLSSGSFSYRIGTTDGALIDKHFHAYIGWLRGEVEKGRTFALEHDAWDAYTVISVDGMPLFAGARAASFVMYKRTKTGVVFLGRDGSWGSLRKAWLTATSSAFGMYKRQAILVRYGIAERRWGLLPEHKLDATTGQAVPPAAAQAA